MRGIDIFCASQAATAIRLSMDEASSSSSPPSSTIHLGGSPAIDRHNPIIRDASRLSKSLPLAAPCASQTPPIAPIPYKHLHHKNRKSSSKPNDQAKKSSSKSIIDQKKKSAIAKPSHEGEVNIRKSWAKPGDFFSPPGSSRYLLGETACLEALPDFDPVLDLVPEDPTKSQPAKPDESSASNSKPPSSSSSSSSSSSRSPDQVVVLRVSLHCKGCEGKVRKHISRMQGVTSFNIDFAAKKVTVVGDVTPLDVLASVSKVKSAQLWTPAMSAPVPTAGSSSTNNHSEIKKSKGVNRDFDE